MPVAPRRMPIPLGCEYKHMHAVIAARHVMHFLSDDLLMLILFMMRLSANIHKKTAVRADRRNMLAVEFLEFVANAKTYA